MDTKRDQLNPATATLQDILSVMLEPRPGHTDDEVVRALASSGASDINVLSPGFISARVPRASVADLETVAHVHIKAFKKLHTIAPPRISRR